MEDAVIENTVGHIYITNYTDDEDIYLRTDDGSGGITNYIQCDGSNGEVKLYHYGSEKLSTRSTGVTVTGTVSDSIGDVRRLGITNHNASTLTLTADHAGNLIREATNSANITLPQTYFLLAT